MKLYDWKSLAAAAVAALSFAGPAAALTCPEPVAGDDVTRYLEATTNPMSVGLSCLASGTEATANNAFEAAVPNFTFLAKEEQGSDDALNGVLDPVGVSTLWGGTTGTFEFTDPGTYQTYAVLFKFGNPNVEDSWFAIEIPGGESVFNIDWATVDSDGDRITQWELSNVSVYGGVPIPVPAGGLLLISGLVGIGLLRRRKPA
ncbi:VPLPA-CTERM sorting domain-containing protein [Rhodosalinus sp. K401]|uniref:VPLPA-CTERM sorting domain-containing protein n=1 Tax=Rhodosalinus sp. K401 TaxID=3239195 RepID=UPI0035269494